jgi:hypothetical protein
MNTSEQVFFAILAALGWIVAPTLLIWGWIRWVRRPKRWTILSILSLVGFLLATASGLVAVSSVIYSGAIGGFAYYDPRLLRIIRVGSLLSMAGFIAGLGGMWRPSSLRWHGPVSALGMFAFWLGTAASE